MYLSNEGKLISKLGVYIMNVALIAHDHKKDILINFVLAYSEIFKKHNFLWIIFRKFPKCQHESQTPSLLLDGRPTWRCQSGSGATGSHATDHQRATASA